MQNDYTYIAEILDRSASMHHIKQGTIDGHNEFIRGQKAAPGKADYMLVQFDHEYQVRFDGNVQDAPELTPATFYPRGNTALHDAIGRTIVTVGEKLAAMPEEERPAKVVIVIITDGQENASSEWDCARVADLIRHQREQYRWEFLFLGANQDAVLAAREMSIPMQNAVTYRADSRNTRETYSNISRKVGGMRHQAVTQGWNASLDPFTEEERTDALRQKPVENKP